MEFNAKLVLYPKDLPKMEKVINILERESGRLVFLRRFAGVFVWVVLVVYCSLAFVFVLVVCYR